MVTASMAATGPGQTSPPPPFNRTFGIMVGAEERELSGIVRRAAASRSLALTLARFAQAIEIGPARQPWLLLAGGAGPRLVDRMLQSPAIHEWTLTSRVDRVLSIGYCGALDPALGVGDIVIDGELRPLQPAGAVEGSIYSVDRVAATAAEKASLYASTGCRVVEMESAAVRQWAAAHGVPYGAVRVVSDTAAEDLPLDFNLYRDPDGGFALRRIVGAALLSPFRVLPGLLRIDRNARTATEKLGEFLAACQY